MRCLGYFDNCPAYIKTTLHGEESEVRNRMENRKTGNAVFILMLLLTVVCWLVSQPVETISTISRVQQLFGALAIVGFACTIFLSTRNRILDRLFNGLDKAYVEHKEMGIFSVAFVFIHFVLFLIGRARTIAATGQSPAETPFGSAGVPSMILFVVFVMIALLAKKMNYETWKKVHKFIVVPYAIGLFHYYGSSSYGAFGFSAFSIWLNIVNIFGISSAMYIVFLYGRTAFRYLYKVSSVRSISKNVTEITGTAKDKDLNFRPGQFTFLKSIKMSDKFPSHPFTMSDAPTNGEITFTIKNLGDHTSKLINGIKTGDEFAVTKPHGMFDYTKGVKNQIWIAGGIGITPFRSFYKSDIPSDFSIDFFYAFHGKEEGSYLDELKTMERDNLRVYLVDDTAEGFLTVEKIRQRIQPDNPVDIYFCGPKPMRESIEKSLKDIGVHVSGFHFENFEFGR